QGQNVSFNAQAANQCGGGLTYQWRFKGVSLSGATGSSYTRKNGQCADAGNYDVVVTNLAGSATSSIASLTVMTAPGIGLPPASQTLAQGQNASFTAQASNTCGGGFAYQWRFNGVSIPGATDASYI